MVIIHPVLLRVAVIFLSFSYVKIGAEGVFTFFNIPEETGNRARFSIADYRIPKLSSLRVPGPNQHDVVFLLFAPKVSGLYTLGVSQATWDPVMIVYEGQSTFRSDSPSLGAIALMDDGYLFNFKGLAIVNNDDPTLNPVIQNIALKAQTDYLIALTPFTAGLGLSLPVEFFVYGDDQVIRGDVSLIPEPACSVAVLGAWALALVSLRRGKRAAGDTP